MKLVFMGTPEFAVPALDRLVADGHEVAAVYTQPPRRAGRGMGVTASPVARLATERGLTVRTPVSLKDPGEQAALAAIEADAAVVVAYGLILPLPVLEASRLGCYNVHASLLPRWRGAAPIQRAIMAGDRETGISIMRVTPGLDEGPVCLTGRQAIAPGTTAGELHDRLAGLGADLLSQALAALEAGKLACEPQPAEGVTYARKIDKAETHIDFSRSANAVLDHIHGLSPVPGAWLALPVEGRQVRVKVLKAEPGQGAGEPATGPGTVLDESLTVACGDGAVRLAVLQREGRHAMDAAEFVRGIAVPPGTRLG